MAEVEQHQSKQKAGVRKTKKASLRVDLTPMVDLGFLLISFFIFTTTSSHPTVMKLGMPDDKDITNPSKAPESKTLNLLLGANNNVYVYNGNEINNIRKLGSDVKNFRAAIDEKKNMLRQKFGSDSDMIVLIKPTAQSTYGNVVNALDEMTIEQIKTYVLMDADSAEASIINSK